MILTQRLIITLFGLTLIGAVSAAPTELTEAEFTAQTAGLLTIVETFDDYPPGYPGSPFTIANGTYTGAPWLAFGGWCILSQCMDNNFVDDSFDEFPDGTTFWSTKLIYASSGDIVQVTVTGNSGVLQYNLPEGYWVPGGVFLGFSDPAGLTSIAFARESPYGANYSYDDVTIAVGPPVTLGIDIDIKFCSDPNAFNCKNKGVLPVTIFGTDTFDIADIDISTLRLCTEDFLVCTEAPRNYSIADRGDPTSDLGAAQCALLEVEEDIFEEQDYLNLDGFLDLDAAFDASEVQEMLGAFCGSSRNAVSETLVITGLTLDGTMILSVPIGNTGTDQLVKKQ